MPNGDYKSGKAIGGMSSGAVITGQSCGINSVYCSGNDIYARNLFGLRRKTG